MILSLIYCAENLMNGKKYIGKTSHSMRDRQLDHHEYARKDSQWAFHRAIRKYGEASFVWTVLLDDLTDEEALHFEMAYIRNLKTKVPNGYNLTDGGEGATGYKFTEDQLEHMRKVKKGVKMSPLHLAAYKEGRRKAQERREALGIKIIRGSGSLLGKKRPQKDIDALVQAWARRKEEGYRPPPQTEESNKKRSEATKGIKKSSEAVENMRRGALNRKPITEEHRKILSEAQKKRFAKLREQV